MRAAPVCPRCFTPLQPSRALPTGWRCAVHGDVFPLQPPHRPTPEALRSLCERSDVPVWLPWPLPAEDWMVSGFAEVEDADGRVRASVVALSGPSVNYGPGDMLVVAEETGIGLGAAYAGLPGPDPGPGFGQGTAQLKVDVMGHPTALWFVDGAADRAVYAGEALGNWLWMIAWPADSGCLIALGRFSLRDLRDNDQEFDLPFGVLSPRLGEERPDGSE